MYWHFNVSESTTVLAGLVSPINAMVLLHCVGHGLAVTSCSNNGTWLSVCCLACCAVSHGHICHGVTAGQMHISSMPAFSSDCDLGICRFHGPIAVHELMTIFAKEYKSVNVLQIEDGNNKAGATVVRIGDHDVVIPSASSCMLCVLHLHNGSAAASVVCLSQRVCNIALYN